MHPHIMVGVVALGLAAGPLTATAAMAQTGGGAPPARIGNRANGLSYQPTPGEVAPREHTAGVAPSAEQQRRTNDELFRLDAQSLKNEGLSTNSVPGHDQGR